MRIGCSSRWPISTSARAIRQSMMAISTNLVPLMGYALHRVRGDYAIRERSWMRSAALPVRPDPARVFNQLVAGGRDTREERYGSNARRPEHRPPTPAASLDRVA